MLYLLLGIIALFLYGIWSSTDHGEKTKDFLGESFFRILLSPILLFFALKRKGLQPIPKEDEELVEPRHLNSIVARTEILTQLTTYHQIKNRTTDKTAYQDASTLLSLNFIKVEKINEMISTLLPQNK